MASLFTLSTLILEFSDKMSLTALDLLGNHQEEMSLIIIPDLETPGQYMQQITNSNMQGQYCDSNKREFCPNFPLA